MSSYRSTPSPAPSFADLGVPAALNGVLERRGIDSPYPIQTATLPDSLAGRDIVGRGRTGSGKTLAFAIPMAARLATSAGARADAGSSARPGPRGAGAPRGLVLVPTRELAEQVHATLAPLATALSLRTCIVIGGVGQQPQVDALRRGADVVVATPGRLEDLIRQGHVRLDRVEVTVLDEADHMADLGFLPAVRRLLDATPTASQRLLFSATIDASVDVLVRRYLRNPVTHSVDSASASVPAMAHHLVTVDAAHKPAVVRELVSGQGRTLAFTRTKHGAKKLAKQLSEAGVPAVDLHGNLSQAARRRNLEAFSTGAVRVLVATDIAARGIHVDDVALVVHVDPPAEHKAYVHRSGRTARAGAEGTVVTVGTAAQRHEVMTLLRRAQIVPSQHRVTPGDDVIKTLVGPPAPPATVTGRPRGSGAAPVTRATGRGRPTTVGARRRRSRRPVADRG